MPKPFILFQIPQEDVSSDNSLQASDTEQNFEVKGSGWEEIIEQPKLHPKMEKKIQMPDQWFGSIQVTGHTSALWPAFVWNGVSDAKTYKLNVWVKEKKSTVLFSAISHLNPNQPYRLPQYSSL